MRLVANLGEKNVPLPDDAEVLVCSSNVALDGGLPSDCAAWLR